MLKLAFARCRSAQNSSQEEIYMKRTIITAGLFIFVLLVSGTALAQRHGHGHRYHVGPIVGLALGGPAFWYGYPGYYAPYSSYYGPYVSSRRITPTVVYVEKGELVAVAPAAPAPQQNWWYYCADAKAYYPYVKECPGGWQRVAPQPTK